MYIRKTSQLDKKTGKPYSTHRLIESYRNAHGQPRQEMLVNLGTHFLVPAEQWKSLTDRVEEILTGQAELLFGAEMDALEQEAQRIAKLVLAKGARAATRQQLSPPSSQIADYQSVDINSLNHQDIRFVGAEAVGYHAAKQLGLAEILMQCGFNEKQTGFALSSIIARLVAPGSERSTHRYLTEQSALDELLNRDLSKLPLHGLYRIGDQIFNKKVAIESALYQREVTLFNLEETVTLYDLTNTYFEGSALENAKAKYGRSKEKRSDCCLVALGMVLDSSGFPKKSKIYEGNISEPATFKEMIAEMSYSGDKKPTIVMDAGIATEENLAWLKTEDYRYIVVSRKKKSSIPEGAELLTLKANPKNKVTAHRVLNEAIGEVELYCHSEAKEAKGAVMKSKFEQRLETELTNLNTGLHKKRGSTRKYDKIMERIGRLKEKYSATAKYYDIEVTVNEDKTEATAISFKLNPDKRNQKADGLYCLRSNHCEMGGEQLWEIYTMLTELEAAFRHLKSELGLRPVYHRVEGRVDAHLFISILAYHLLHTIRYQLKGAGIHDSWQQIRSTLKTHIRLTSTLKLENGRTLHIRKNSLPNIEQRRIYEALDMPMQSLAVVKHYC
jgi:transposase